ncbi:MAG TPA: bifunctional phosphopantothenoylcysteine decarboxylase/phosphopantothenate--cysteine ligase CoaBC [Gammaproteobacteria bacterium]|nr:bifunctional phosphopantothenoylcysteine decarboxylase/phosphopantothenate--cysteine ligase CoaBC [Gammaproteobacteria bacterium]
MNTPTKYLQQRRILIGITGGIAAYKICELIRRLKEQGAEVKTILTAGGKEFITPLTIRALSGETDVEDAMSHITLARWAEVLLVAPASANFIAKFTHGLADDLLTTTCLATTAPILIAPAMNQQMWQNHATQQNMALLKQRAVTILGPNSGEQACGETGPGRMLEPHDLLQALDTHFAPRLLHNKHVLITAGPTQEAIDPVRYLSNHSSGKMGYALASAALKLGAKVTLISGPTQLSLPATHNLEIVHVKNAAQMLNAVMQHIKAAQPKVDFFVGCAAVADYTPAEARPQKIKKNTATFTLELTRTADILQAVAQLPASLRPFTIGFAAETENLLQNAQQKLHAKCLDMVIANAVDNGKVFGQEENQAWIIRKDLPPVELPIMRKEVLAVRILEDLSCEL